MSPEVRLELQRLLSALCDGVLEDAQHARLEELLAADADCRRQYLEYVDMHARLLVHPSLGPSLDSDKETGRQGDKEKKVPAAIRLLKLLSVRKMRKISQIVRYGLVAAGTLAASLLVQWFLWAERPSRGIRTASQPAVSETQELVHVATLIQAVGCSWENTSQPWRVGSHLPPGELRLGRGVARIRIENGPDLLIEGPANLHLESRTAATVLQGKVVFKGDETAAPFDLHTPTSTLVDFGTEYAVAVGPEGEEVHVFDGEIRRVPKTEGQAEPEQLSAGEARRYDRVPQSPGQPVPLDQERFVRQILGSDEPLPDPMAGLLAYEGFDYQDPEVFRANKAEGGRGWISPWKGFARPAADPSPLALNVKDSLVRPGAAVPSVGGSFDFIGFTKYYRRLATPVRMDTDGVYYLSFLFRRQGPPADPLNAVAVLLRTTHELRKEDPAKRLDIGVGGVNHVFTHLNRIGCRTPMPLSYGETYLLVAKIVASRTSPDQIFLRLYGPQESVERDEPGSWSVIGPPVHSDLVFDWLEVHINSKTRQTIDEVRLGTTWASVTAPWIQTTETAKQHKP
jgi:hypothetical protein